MLIPLLFVALCAPPFVQDDDGPKEEGEVAVRLSTREGQSMSGVLTPTDDGALGLRCEGFAEDLRIRAGDVASVDILSAPDPTESAPETEGAGRFEFVLTGGDRLQGSVVAIEGARWTVDAVGLGPVQLAAEDIVRADSLGGGALIYNGPTGTDGWVQDADHGFTAAADHLYSSDPKGLTAGDFGLDQPRDVQLEIGWQGAPRFRIAAGSGDGVSSRWKGVVLEVWGTSLVAWADTGKSLEVVELVRDLEDDGTLTLELLVTPESVTILQGDQELGTVSRPKAGKFLSFANDGARLEVRSVSVYAGGDVQRPTRRDARMILGVDAKAGTFLTEAEPIQVTDVLGLDFGAPAVDPDPDLFWLTYEDGRRVGGRHVGASTEGWLLQTQWTEQPVSCALTGLREVRAVAEGAGRRRRRSSRSFLVAEQGEIAGELVSISAEGEILWKPSIAEGMATVDREAIERVVINRETAYFVSSRKFPHQLRLRSGDMFRCRLIHVGKQELRFESSFGGEHTLATDRLKAIEFDVRKMDQFRELFAQPDQDPANRMRFFGIAEDVRRETSDGFDPDSLERALSLPRKYKRRRFEHLILARTGDFLRTELLSWSPETGAVYPGLSDDTRSIADDRLAAVVWLAESGAESAAEIGARVVLDDQTRLGLDLSRAEDGFLVGTSPVLGELRIDLTHVMSIELASDALAPGTTYEEWVLKPMREPFPDEQSGPQVGAAAPATRGEDLSGTEFALADYRGKVVLLDFWGHW